jgi:hypothetical protein
VIFRPSFRPALIGMALLGATPAFPAEDASGQEPPSACQVRLSSGRAVFKALGEVKGEASGPEGCGGPDVVLLQKIILPDDHAEVAVEPPATLRCEMAEAVAEFVRHDLAAAADVLGSPLRAVENYDSFDCRGRNRIAGAKLSEHGLANALDIHAVKLKDGRVVQPTDVAAAHAFRIAMKTAACERFTTVLGPGSDGYHEDHVHLDRIERRGGYRMCQWDVRDEPRFALQSAVAQKAVAQRAALPLLHAAAAARIQEPVPLPRPRPSKAASARAVVLPTESRR